MFDFKQFFSGKVRLGIEFDNQNGVATNAVFSFGISLYLLLFLKNKARYFFAAVAASALWVGISTGSRTFIIAIYVLSATMGFYFFRHRFIYLFIFLGISIAAFIIFNFFADNRLIKAFYTLLGIADKTDTATLSREIYQDYGLLLGSRNLIIGYGCNGFGKFSGVGTYAHSNIAEVLCDFGIIGTILFYSPLLVFLVRGIKFKKIDKAFIIPFIIYYLVVSFSNVFYYKKIYYLLLAYMFYLSYDDPLFFEIGKKIHHLKRVLFVCNAMTFGGAERVIATLSNEFSNKGIKTGILGVADYLNKGSSYELNGDVEYCSLTQSNGKRINPIKRVYLLRKYIFNFKPDVVISFLPNANIYTTISLFFSEIPHIVSERNNPFVNPKEKVTRVLKKVSFILADACVFQSSYAMEYYPYLVVRKSRIIKNPLPKSIERNTNNHTRNKVVVAVGRLEEQKNYYCLLNAFKAFNASNGNAYSLHIYGSGSLLTELINYCNKIGVSDYVVFAGNDKEWYIKEKLASMYVLSSNYEGMPNSLIEAMAVGIPSISSDCPVWLSKEIICDGVNGYLFPVNDSKALFEKMKMIDDNTAQLFFDNTRNIAGLLSSESISNEWVETCLSIKENIYE